MFDRIQPFELKYIQKASPKEIGHSWANSTTTDIYIRFDMKKVDEANRKVIDFVNNINM